MEEVVSEIETTELTPTLFEVEEEIIAEATHSEAAWVEETVSEEAVPEIFELNMEAEPAVNFTPSFVLQKPVNIYEATEEPVVAQTSAPIFSFEFDTNEVVSNEMQASNNEELMQPVAETTSPVVEFETSFRMVEQVVEEAPEMQLVMREEQPRPVHQDFDMPTDNAEEQRRKVAERIQKLRNLSFNINNGSDPNTEFDAVPAYVRRNLDLFGNTMASVENYYSKYTVEQDENNQTQISTINSFLDGKKPD